MSKKIMSFTLLETIVSLLLSGILICIVYTCYFIIERSYTRYDHENGELSVLLRVDKVLKADFAKARFVLRSDSGLICENDSGRTLYQLDTSFIIRKTALADTFHCQTQLVKQFYKQQPREIYEQQSVLIDELELDISFRNTIIPYIYHKSYSSANLFSIDSNAVNRPEALQTN